MEEQTTALRASAMVVLTPSESKRLIARGVAALPCVRHALDEGWVIIANGTTTAFVAEEILGKTVDKFAYAAGYIGHGRLAVTSRDIRWAPFVLHQGEVVDVPVKEAMRSFGAHDVLIKGANCLDPGGRVGILMASDEGGTVAMALGPVRARGSHLVVPVGLEKLIPSVLAPLRYCGIHRLRYATGNKVGLMVLDGAEIITEVEALRLLAGVEPVPVAAGGIGDTQGAMTLVFEAEAKAVERAFNLVQEIKGESPVVPSQGHNRETRQSG